MRARVWVSVAVLLTAVAGTAYWRLTARAPAPEVAPSEVPAGQPPSWDELRANIERMDSVEVRQYGLQYFRDGDPDRAFLMFKHASRKGDGWSALAIGRMYDPATFASPDFDAGRTAFSKPNPRKALDWYDRAIELGEAQAQPMREKLIAHLRETARAGDAAAKLILQKVDR